MLGLFKCEGTEDSFPSPPTPDMVFHPHAELELLAISYDSQGLVTCNPWTLEQTASRRVAYSLNILATTPNGRLLAGGDQIGTIHFFLFESLQPLYRIHRPGDFFRLLSISLPFDNARLVDIRGYCCDVWEPHSLNSNNFLPDAQDLELPLQEVPLEIEWKKRQDIMHILPTESGVIFTLRHTGAVDVCDTSTGACIQTLDLDFQHEWITHMDWNESRHLLLTADQEVCTVTSITFDEEALFP